MNGAGVHRSATFVLSLLMAAIGVALIVESLAGAGGSVSVGLLLGALFVAAGALRIYSQVRRGPRE